MSDTTTQQSRAPRDSSVRAKAEVRVESWRPSTDLPVPNPVPGYVFHWKRKSMGGQNDPKNMAAARREGWVPCKIVDHPEFADDLAAFGVSASDDIIEIGGLVLCKTSAELVAQRNQYYDNLTHQNTVAVNNNFMREQDARMPMFNESSSSAKFGRGF